MAAIEMRTCPSSRHSRCCSSCRIRRCMPISLVRLRLPIRRHAVSSNPLPDLELEPRTPWGLLALVCGWLLAVAVELWRAEGIPRPWLPFAVVVLALALFPIGRLACGSVAAALTRIVWRADGTWSLRDGHGWDRSAVLAAGSRRWGHVTLLVWRGESRRSWAILTPFTVGSQPYRRLCVRLKLRRHAQSDGSLYNPPAFEPRHSQLRHLLTRTFPKGQGHRGGAGWLGHRSGSPDGHRGQRPDASRARPEG